MFFCMNVIYAKGNFFFTVMFFVYTDSRELYKISNQQTIGLTEVEFMQLVVDGVKLLIRIEKRLEDNTGIDDLVPAQK